MRKIFLPVLLVASLGVSSAAMAATMHTTKGAIKALDAKACTVTLVNKDVFHLGAKCDLSKLSVGENVTVTWHVKNKLDWASKIVPTAA